MIEKIKHLFGFSKTFGVARSPLWSDVRKQHIKSNPLCAVCDRESTILNPNEVHHIHPFHLDPILELTYTNLITLCRPHHYLFGHFNDWESFNPNVEQDTRVWRLKIKNRP